VTTPTSTSLQVTAQPALADWQPTSAQPRDAGAIRDAVRENAKRLGTPALGDALPMIAGGHQAWLWHPGILAKDMAASACAAAQGGSALHVVVDQDAHDALRLALPVLDGDELRVLRLTLGDELQGVPTGMQPPTDAGRVVETLRRAAGDVAADVGRLIRAWSDLPETVTLGEQLTVVLHRLRAEAGAAIAVLMGTQLHRLPSFAGFVEQMVGDARACAAAYNHAAAARPGAGIAPLRVERDRVELPLWSLRWQRPRARVFADVSDTRALLVDEAGETVAVGGALQRDGCRLAPRALMLTACMRRFGCNLFVHGKGGGVYDGVMEQWIESWLGERAAPMAVASADLRLRFDMPVADGEDVARAVWWRHHLPHNIDRAAMLDTEGEQLARRKRAVLAAMPCEPSRARRAELFAELHAINDALAQRHAPLLADATHRVQRARLGRRNRAVAMKRDWCFGLYPAGELAALARRFEG